MKPSVALISASLALVVTATTLATPRARPSDRACLVAWNSAANHANHLRLLAQRPVSGVQLLPGVIGKDRWTKEATRTQTNAPACLLTVAKPGRVRMVSGIWQTAGISRWSFGPPIPTSKPVVANVRLLSDGRVAKIYRH